MNHFVIMIILLMITGTPVSAADSAPVAGVVALVNGVGITQAEYRAELSRMLRVRKKSEQEFSPAKVAMIKKEALESLVGRELLYQQSQRDGLRVKDSEVDAEISKLRNQFQTDDDFSVSLGKMELSREAVRQLVRRGLMIQRLSESRFAAKTIVAEKEARNFYDSHQEAYKIPTQIRLSHILVKPGTIVTREGTISARARIEKIRDRINQGEVFKVLARESDDSASREIDGDLGYFTPGQLSASMESSAFSLEVGQVSPIIEDRFGYHILKVTERRTETVQPFEEVRERITAQLQRDLLLSELSPYLKRLREDARVEIYTVEESSRL